VTVSAMLLAWHVRCFGWCCRLDVRAWSDEKLKAALVAEVAEVAEMEADIINTCVASRVAGSPSQLHSSLTLSCAIWVMLLGDVYCYRSESLTTHMDSLVLFQLHQSLSQKFGLFLGDDDVYSDKMSIDFIVDNRLVR